MHRRGYTVPQVRTAEIEFVLCEMNSKLDSDWIRALARLQSTFKRIAHFGCSSGAETLALMEKFGADMVYGIDRDVNKAEQEKHELKDWISESQMALDLASTPVQMWWQASVPRFFKEKRYPEYVEEPDIAQPRLPYQVPSSCFDLSCCSHLLYQILEYQGAHAVLNAIKEMKRVTVADGWVVADEPDDGQRGRLVAFFEQAGLKTVKIDSVEFRDGIFSTTYFFRNVDLK